MLKDALQELNSSSDDYLSGCKIVRTAYNFPITLLKRNGDYQRTIDKARTNKIAESIKDYGYWDFSIIITNINLEIIDGQHRVDAAQICNLKSLPVCIMDFKTKQHEIKFFVAKNNHSTQLNNIDFWDARFKIGHLVAKIIYELDSNTISMLHNRISLKGKRGGPSNFTIGNVQTMLFACFGAVDVWRRCSDDKLSKMLVDYSFSEIMNRVNKLVGFIEGSFGLKSGNLAYRKENFYAIMSFYNILMKKDKTLADKAIGRMKSFIFVPEHSKLTHAGRLFLLIGHYNKGKKGKSLIEYVPI